MKIGGKEIGMMYTVGAHVRWNAYIVKNQDTALAEAQIEKIMIMHDEWCRVHKIPEAQRVTKGEIMAQPFGVLNRLLELSDAQMKADGEVTIEAESKNVESTAITS